MQRCLKVYQQQLFKNSEILNCGSRRTWAWRFQRSRCFLLIWKSSTDNRTVWNCTAVDVNVFCLSLYLFLFLSVFLFKTTFLVFIISTLIKVGLHEIVEISFPQWNSLGELCCFLKIKCLQTENSVGRSRACVENSSKSVPLRPAVGKTLTTTTTKMRFVGNGFLHESFTWGIRAHTKRFPQAVLCFF